MSLINPSLTDLPPLPQQARTRSGYVFSPRALVWRIPDQSGSLSFNFGTLGESCTPCLVRISQHILTLYLEQYSTLHSHNMFELFKHYARTTMDLSGEVLGAITAVSVMNYKAALTKDESWFLSSLAGFLKKWHALGHPGIDDEVPRLLRNMRLKGNKKGEAVLTQDPQKGPFLESELSGLLSVVNDGYATGKISVREYLLVLLFCAIAARPVQFSSLKIMDFKKVEGSNGAKEYFLDVPRAKQRDSYARDEFKTRVLVAEIGELLTTWVDLVKGFFAEEIRNGFNPSELPIFPTRSGRTLEMTKGFEFHTRGKSLSYEIVSIFGHLSIVSPRTGKDMNVTPTRFRRTLGTRAAEEGLGELIIAFLLDHSDTQNAGVYVQSTPKVLERIDAVLSQHLAPIAQAFQGKIISHPSEAERGSDPRARIRSPYAPEKDNGVCGKYGFCSASAPVACYTCRNFQAWVDGPHEQILELLIAERERVFAITGDSRIASANDQTIIAVKAVIERCHAQKAAGGSA